MNSIWIVLAVALWLILGYTIYGRFIEKKLKINNKNITPAKSNKRNKIDYSASSQPFLIGHHFASIAGAGPIIGPILAISYFGWLPVVLWVSLGSVFIGAMHDYIALIASVRNKGKGVAKIAEEQLGSKSGKVFGVMIWITLVLIMTVFSVSAADSIIQKPDLVIPLITISLTAIIIGQGVKKYNWNYKIASLIALIIVFFSVWVGLNNPINLPFQGETLRNVWISLILIYAGTASVLPVSFLLRPRDYVSALQSFVILTLGIIAILIVRPIISAPAYQSSPIFPLWPILFITVACGAVSGFHGLVSSGTTSKQLSKESHAKSVAYGAMLLEGALAVFVTLVVVSGIKWGTNPGEFYNILEKGWIVLFSEGYGNIVSVGIPFLTMAAASLLGALMVNQFVLTTVDASTRISRFVLSESLIPKLKNRFITTALALIPAWLIAITNSYEVLWRLFGSSNQLIASISMITISSYSISKKIKTKFIIIPSILVLITTLAALAFLAFNPAGYLANKNYVLVIISCLMFLLGLVVAYEGFRKIIKK